MLDKTKSPEGGVDPSAAPKRSLDFEQLRMATRGVYAIQKLRIQAGNRVVANFRIKLGQEPGHGTDEMDDEAKKILRDYKQAFSRITDSVVSLPTPRQFKPTGCIDSYTEMSLVYQYTALLKAEETMFNNMGHILRKFPIYTEYLKDEKGIGPAIASILVTEIDITKATYASSLWKLAGLDVAEDGKGRSRRKEHLVERDYEDKEGNPATRMSLTFKPLLKTKLTGVLGPSLLKCKNERYAKVYHDYKHRLEHHAVYKDTTKLHRHRMAIRYMVKIFLIDLYKRWRTLEGLPVAVPYHVAKLGMRDHDDLNT